MHKALGNWLRLQNGWRGCAPPALNFRREFQTDTLVRLIGGGDAAKITSGGIRGRCCTIARSRVADGVTIDDQFDAAVALPALGCVVGSHGLRLTESLGAH
jgi:hypothetical protein